MRRNGEEVEFITPSLEVRTKMLDMIKNNRQKNRAAIAINSEALD